jgi:dTDP-glucose 4,6-dehydratase
VWSYETLLRETAEIKARRLVILPVPVMTPGISSHWLRFTTDVQYAIARPLAESMRNPVTVDSKRDLQNVIPIDRTEIPDAIRQALAA